MTFPRVAIDAVVPPAIVRDIRRELGRLQAKGASHFMIQVPAEDFAATMSEVCRHIQYPFTPTLCGQAVGPWEHPIVGVMAKADPQQVRPIIFTADGRELEV